MRYILLSFLILALLFITYNSYPFQHSMSSSDLPPAVIHPANQDRIHAVVAAGPVLSIELPHIRVHHPVYWRILVNTDNPDVWQTFTPRMFREYLLFSASD